MTARLRVLTFCRHEPYLYTLAKTGHEFEVCERLVQSLGYVRSWNTRLRPVPSNVTLITEVEMRERSQAPTYDVIVCHDVDDLLCCLASPSAKILVHHVPFPYSETELLEQSTRKREFIRSIQRLFIKAANIFLVFISTQKQERWGFRCPSRIIPHGIDLDEFSLGTGTEPAALRVCNGITRNKEGLEDLLEICKDLPLNVIGDNEGPVVSRSAESFEELREVYRAHRVYVNTTVDGLEDGYTLSMLEAMASGVPVVTTWNRSTPIVNGLNGFVSTSNTVLRERLAELLAKPEEARRLGRGARDTVERQFPLAMFKSRWDRVLREASLFAATHA